ncbi:LysR substrate-binding domain-containing protein [Cohaesibacter gelatinilyticus]|uniref:Transcriptional regulator, LysR family n=1 Tax=Cohaesibacter gelatinilyticus TaxID=372072 RepID=A0A285NBF3_9HYPH|nr:LysR substrate-binding domain-containing protein [Cohaesibacter gelatinilyticus]SNZ06638.1 transcriptional regulator, LysR family [Cohaesibacter gelatinilyticus]
MKLSINQLRALEAVVRTGSFSAAAKELGISQPSVSNHLLALEKHYCAQLIHRNGRLAEPTELCSEVLSRIRSVLAMTREVEQILEGRKQLQTGTIRLGYSTYQFALPVISKFMEQYPDVNIEARAMASHDLMPLLQDGNFDVAFISAKSPPPEVNAFEMRIEQMVAVVGKEHPLAQFEMLQWKQLADLPLIQREKSSETRRVFEANAIKAGISLKTVLALGSWGSIVTSVQSGMGVGIAMAGEVTELDNLVAIPIDDNELTVSHFLICLPEMQHIASIQAIFDIASQ